MRTSFISVAIASLILGASMAANASDVATQSGATARTHVATTKDCSKLKKKSSQKRCMAKQKSNADSAAAPK